MGVIRAGACIFGLRVEFFDTFFYPLLALLPPATSIVHSGVASIFMFDLLRRPQHYRAGEVNAPFRTVRAAYLVCVAFPDKETGGSPS